VRGAGEGAGRGGWALDPLRASRFALRASRTMCVVGTSWWDRPLPPLASRRRFRSFLLLYITFLVRASQLHGRVWVTIYVRATAAVPAKTSVEFSR
jgi:hypothetical protein